MWGLYLFYVQAKFSVVAAATPVEVLYLWHKIENADGPALIP